MIASDLKIKHHVISISLPWKGSALLDSTIAIPEGRSTQEMNASIPSTYVPARNTIFLALAASCAEAEGADTLMIGANVLDYSGYPDCRPEFLNAFMNVISKGTKAGAEGKTISIEAPLLKLNKAEIIQLAVSLKVPIEKTWSCYKGGENPCGECDSCRLRQKGFEEAKLAEVRK